MVNLEGNSVVSPQIDPQLVARLSGEFDALGLHMRGVAADLTRLRSQLEIPAPQPAPQAPASAPPPVYAAQPPVPQPQVQWPTTPAPPAPQAVPPVFAQPAQWPPVRPQAARREPREPWWQRDGMVSRVLAVAGAAVTLIGVLMLLVLAAQAGFFGPVARVSAGAVFSVALVAAGIRVFGRPGGRVGGLALVGTGVAGGYLDVVAATSYYGWLPPVVGLAVAFGIAAGGMTLATRWQSQPLAALIVVAVAVLAPALADGLTVSLLVFLVLLQVAAFPPQLGRDWPYLHAARTIPVVLAMLIALADASWSGASPWSGGHRPVAVALLALAVVVAVVGVGSALVLVRRNTSDVTATVMLALSTLPLLFSGGVAGRWTEVALQCGLAAGLLTVSALVRPLPGHTRVAVAAVASLAVLQASAGASPRDALPVVLLAVALGLVAVAGQARSRIAYCAGIGFGSIGALLFLDAAPPEALVNQAGSVGSLAVIASGSMLAALVVLVVGQAHSMGLLEDRRADAAWVAAGIGALYAGTAAVVATGVAVLGADRGFIAGHCAATLVAMMLATVSLRWGLAHQERAHLALGAGLTLTFAALAKLFLFDLATLDGMFRVLAFIGVGLLLLAAGTRYARAFAEGAQRGRVQT
ncbi:putative membrane protein DUF2339 [Rhodococcus sp. OK611]|jgi:uncharacterized membrane protein|uniref:DUF2339 domain-containing protein n=1 Tax=unclassified Rhodococcus (in: high G+C Gram-positive bacteria) TaxID=192944 RepID=UPI000BD26F8D|nr:MULTISPECIES: DUF2339 domain-containing protein [unclassified Rhodococcus (in: high G+C Gram-positive bacteria)]PTR37178.1 putative membrane protein DUF2339 [Rhodococcus sp. OK611]SNX93511.1 Predicted membrane protein [Rhodococcus sp. OK270]